MKINPLNNSRINPYQRNADKVNQLKNSQKPLDKVEISSQAKDMQEISKISKERQARVEELKVQVENGTYKVDSREIAKNMLKFYKGQ
jgi:negative regulator of flagellin synthesis FlgM